MNEVELPKFEDVESAPWFGIADERDSLFRSIVSNYDHTLTEFECELNPLRFSDYSLPEQSILKQNFSNFFESQLIFSHFMNYCDSKLENLNMYNIHIFIDRFFKEYLDVFINFEKNIIFCMSHDLEIVIYSKEPFIVDITEGLYVRAQNDLVAWNEVPFD
jgi:hypothetical protein